MELVRWGVMLALLVAGLAFSRRALRGGLPRLTGLRRRPRRQGGPAGQESEEHVPATVRVEGGRGRPGDMPVSGLKVTGRRVEGHLQGTAPDAVEAINQLLAAAYSVGASDVHVTPDPKGAQVTYRVDGMLYEVARVPRTALARLVSRVKVVSKLSIYVHEQPQDGRLILEFPDTTSEVRVSVLPTSHGEKVVMRLHHASTEKYDLERLGLSSEGAGDFRLMLGRPQGLVFLTGPTGSGKTTTIYSSLRHILGSRGDLTNVVTIEDPIEFDVPGASQTQVNPATGLTFADGLRSILRQDPDVIVVGEIRDRETAKIALQAGLSGHLILTTIHAESAAGVFTRLIDMEMEPFLLASATAGVLSQRLVRCNCPSCREEKPVSPTQARLLARLGVSGLEGDFFTGAGCEQCLGKGLLGRTGLYELLTVDPVIQELVTQSVPTGRLHSLAVERGMKTLLEDGLEKAREGGVPLDEVLRVAT